MKNKLTVLSISISLFLFANSSFAAGESVTIMANGASGVVTQQSAATLSVTIEISAGDSGVVTADWWLLARASGSWYYYDLGSGFTPGFAVSFQGGLPSISSVEVLRMSGLSAGTYSFFFGFDTALNGEVDMDALVYQSVTVVVEGTTPSPVPPPTPGSLIQPTDIVYLGAFRLPEDPAHPSEGWEWGGLSLAYYPGGDPSGASDGYPGSLYGTGNAQHMWVGEISIPAPVISVTTNIEDLNMATLLRGFTDIRSGIASLEQLYANRMVLYCGLEYLPAQGSQSSGKLYACFGDHFHDEGSPQYTPTHMWTDLDLQSNHSGAWWISTQSLYSVNQYMFELPASWADANANTAGRYLVTGRHREGGWSGQGPALIAIGPWLSGNPPPANTVLTAFPLLLYSTTYFGEDNSHTMTNYHLSDNWFDGACLTAGDRSAVVFLGLKGIGSCWYGWSDGTVFDEDANTPVPPYPNNDRGWWSSSFQTQIIFYNPSDLAAVAAGTMAPYQPQPYATLSLDSYLWNLDKMNHPDFVVNRNKYRVGGLAFDRTNGLLYIAEDRGDAANERPLIHVFRVN
jgi:hypothetical protein